MLPLSRMLTVEKMMTDKVTYGTMNLFGIIVYTEEHPFVVRMLKNQEFWESLNSRTRGWILYAVRPDNRHRHLTEDYLLPQLGIKDSEDLPQLILLATSSNGEIKQQNYPIDDSDENAAYRSIEKILKIVRVAAKKINPEELDGPNVHREITAAIDAELATARWKRISSELAKFVFGLLGLRG